MNVSKGDLAIVVGCYRPELNGMTCETIDFYDQYTEPAWLVRTSKPVTNIFGLVVNSGTICDRYLRRICPPQNQLIPDPVEMPIEVTV